MRSFLRFLCSYHLQTRTSSFPMCIPFYLTSLAKTPRTTLHSNDKSGHPELDVSDNVFKFSPFNVVLASDIHALVYMLCRRMGNRGVLLCHPALPEFFPQYGSYPDPESMWATGYQARPHHQGPWPYCLLLSYSLQLSWSPVAGVVSLETVVS